MAIININKAAISEVFNAAKSSSALSFLTTKAAEASKYINAGLSAGGLRGVIFQVGVWSGASMLVTSVISRIGKLFGFAKDHKIVTAVAAAAASAAIPGVRTLAAERFAAIAEMGAANPNGPAGGFTTLVEKTRQVAGQVVNIQ